MSAPKGPPPGSMSMPPSADVSQMMNQGLAQKLSEQGVGGQQSQQALQQMMAGQAGGGAGGPGQQTKPPRPVGTIKEEVVRAGEDIFNELKGLLGLQRPPKTPEEQAKLQQFHQKWQQMTAEEQQVAQMRIQEEMQRKEMMKQEEEMKKQQEAMAKQDQGLSMPQGKRTGQAAVDKMQQDRKSMGGASG